MMMYSTNRLGFLPAALPHQSLSGAWSVLDDIAADLPDLVAGNKFRSVADDLEPIALPEKMEIGTVERLMLLYSYFASAYVWGGSDEEESKFIPRGISIPLVLIADKLGRLPILSYASYCLNNWKIKGNQPHIVTARDVVVDEIELLQKFVKCYDEDWFILIHVDIEAKGGDALRAITELRTHAGIDAYYSHWMLSFKTLLNALKAMNKTFARMPEKCSSNVYFNTVRPYIHGFEGVVYEDCFDNKPQSYRGETGAQSSLIPAIQLALGIRHKQSMLTEHLDDMRRYMPVNHRDQLAALEASVKPYPKDYRPDPSSTDIRKGVMHLGNKDLKNIYNDCIEELWKFRDQHFVYAVDYIHKRVSDPKGTGGTPYMQWLKELRDETKEYLL